MVTQRKERKLWADGMSKGFMEDMGLDAWQNSNGVSNGMKAGMARCVR